MTSFGLAGSKTSFEIRIRQLLPETFSFDSEFLTLRGGPWAKARGSVAGAIVRAAKMVLLFSSAGYEGAQGRKDERKGGSGKDAGLVVLLVLARAVLRECAR